MLNVRKVSHAGPAMSTANADRPPKSAGGSREWLSRRQITLKLCIQSPHRYPDNERIKIALNLAEKILGVVNPIPQQPQFVGMASLIVIPDAQYRAKQHHTLTRIGTLQGNGHEDLCLTAHV
jgi:hypothetical protein